MEEYTNFLKNFTDFIFLEDDLEPADVIFVPGNGYPQMAERAAALWKAGYAPFVLPSGRYSVTLGHFAGVAAREEQYPGPYETEWEFLADVLMKNGVPREAVLREDQATYTWQNALFSRKVTDRKQLVIRKAIICCRAHHARRCRMYYQLEYPDTRLMICPSGDTGVDRNNWYRSEEGIDAVLGEIRRCGDQFHQILRDIMPEK